jgi:hypothetical protein
MDLNRVTRLAETFRNALVQCDKAKMPEGLRNFPLGSCGDASLLLAEFLRQHCLGDFNYVMGYRGDGTHAWLQHGDLIVDITAGQFEENDYPVVVTYNSEWHKTLNGRVENRADFRVYDAYTRVVLSSSYRLVLAAIPPEAQPSPEKAPEGTAPNPRPQPDCAVPHG